MHVFKNIKGDDEYIDNGWSFIFIYPLVSIISPLLGLLAVIIFYIINNLFRLWCASLTSTNYISTSMLYASLQMYLDY
jgi:hypothetical protein